MKKFHLLVILSFILVLNPIREASAKQQLDCKKLAQIFKAGVEDENGICSVEIVRRDLNVTHMGQKMSPETMELAFHFSFEKVDNQTAVMGELALLEEEVNPVITELQKGKLEVTALHNHMIHERPRIMYVHFQGLGDMMQQANTIKKAIEKTGHK
ncbi:DUF1259 domain-containing protein [Neobacillus sp. LXY-4]|uniref:DUF1259 domain-containing protein n=1 Tax=Neobacillus sp. LXY-4 TaxID=3379826 RepID=UPI003EDF28E0